MVDYWVPAPEGGRDSASNIMLLLNAHTRQLCFVQSNKTVMALTICDRHGTYSKSGKSFQKIEYSNITGKDSRNIFYPHHLQC